MGAAGAVAAVGAMFEIAGNLNEGLAQDREGRATAKALEHNAELKERNADQIERQTAEDERRLRIQNRAIIGTARANYGASGVTLEGTAMDVLQDSAANAEMDALNFRLGGTRQAESVREDAQGDRERAKSVLRATKFNALSAIFGAGKAAIGAYPTISRSMSPGSSEQMLRPKTIAE